MDDCAEDQKTFRLHAAKIRVRRTTNQHTGVPFSWNSRHPRNIVRRRDLRHESPRTGRVCLGIESVLQWVTNSVEPSVSPDGQYAIYTQNDQAPGSDLMLVENFR